MPGSFRSWQPFQQAECLRRPCAFDTGFALEKKGDHMAMAGSVEAMLPFLDHRVVEFAASLPPQAQNESSGGKIPAEAGRQGQRNCGQIRNVRNNPIGLPMAAASLRPKAATWIQCYRPRKSSGMAFSMFARSMS